MLDLATVSDQEIKNDDIVYFLFLKETGSEREEIQLEALARTAVENHE